MNALILAAGLSTRMGRQKLLLPFGASTVIETVVNNVHAANFARIFAVFSAEVAQKFVSHPKYLSAAINPAPELGQSSSLLIGLDLLPSDEDFCIMLGDLPLVRPVDMTSLFALFQKLPAGKTVLAPCRNGRFGHPMFYRGLWRERFRSAAGDAGGRNILLTRDGEIVRVEAPDAHFRDLDTPEDYKSILKDN